MSTRNHRARPGRLRALVAVLVLLAGVVGVATIVARQNAPAATTTARKTVPSPRTKGRTEGAGSRSTRNCRSSRVSRRQHWTGGRRAAAGLRHARTRRSDIQHEMHRLSRPARFGHRERPAGWGAGNAHKCGTHQNDWKLLAICDDGVRLCAPRDALSDAALAQRSGGLRAHGVLAQPQRHHYQGCRHGREDFAAGPHAKSGQFRPVLSRS